MYLKSIEVHGFKSFANKIVFQFHNGITGIVGPNGSGKSNVADAVRWVLGEQRVKQLRGSNMQDVIFSGTELRKPLSYASVAITIDNSDHQLAVDYEEVTVTRRLYRSGESEYLLNGTQCRLRDIHEMFYDTGIGKEGYSIIGQGQIDKILSGKPEDRRELFDEAAGIVKFKRRKETAQKKLESEQQNLVRANDILSEIEKRIGPLEKQSETAKIFLKKKEELKTYDVNLFLMELDRIRQSSSEVEIRLSDASHQLEATQKEYEKTKQVYEQVEEQVSQLDQTLDEKRRFFNEASVQKEQLEGRLNVLKEQIHSARLQDEHIAGRIAQLEESRITRQDERKTLLHEQASNAASLANLKKEQEQHLRKLQAIQEEIETHVQQTETDKAAIIDLLNQRASLKAGQQKFATMMEQVQIQKSELTQTFLRLQTDKEQYTQELSKKEQALSEIEQSIETLMKESEALSKQLEQRKQQMKAQSDELSAFQQQLIQKRSRQESLINLTERYEGYGNSIRRVMEKKDEYKGVIGVVADIIQTEKKYETAIETALGGSIQNIVTKDEQTAKAMIRYLKEHRYGRATFLPLTSIRVQNQKRANDSAIRKEAGVIAIASELVKTDKEHTAVKDYLLGRFYVVDHMEHAASLAAKYEYSLRIVTLEGELFNPGGSMTGGAFKNTSNLLGRRREIEELSKEIQKQTNKVLQLQAEVKELRRLQEEQTGQLEAKKEALQKQYLRQNTAKMKLGQIRTEKKACIEELEKLSRQQESIELQISAIEAQKAKVQQDMQKSSGQRLQLEEEIEKRSQEIEDKREVESAYTKQSVEYQVEYSNVQQQAEFIQKNIDRMEEELQAIEEEYQTLQKEVADSKEEVLQKEATLNSVSEGITRGIKQIETVQSEIEVLQSQREELISSNRAFFDKREELSEQIRLLDKECFRLNSQKERLEEARESQINYMWEEYELTFSSAAQLRNVEFTNLSELKRMCKELREQIKSLGDVHVSAIEEYKEVSQRYEFLKTQRDDLVKAEETLLGIISELDDGMRKQFTEKFALIKQEFDKAFQDLFGGGKGTLELVEDEDVLEAGIRIISQPPGKKLQNMMQLSGGEKALTAIALLFAIQNLKPSPFCLLDEIEAALDDSNVGRFAAYLHNLTKHTQFIVITHRRGTMAAADRLYGITMQEKGVSTLVSVNLIEEQLDQ